MVVVKRDNSGTPTVWCDPCIEPLIRALNDAGIATTASCCGHGFRPGAVQLADGRELIVCADYETARVMERAWPVDINGKALSPPMGVKR